MDFPLKEVELLSKILIDKFFLKVVEFCFSEGLRLH
jgi:hypothetical protein